MLDNLSKDGSLPTSARRFHYDNGAAAAKIKDLERVVAARDAALAELPRRAAAQAETTGQALAALESRLEKLHREADQAAEEAAKKLAAAEQQSAAARDALTARDNELAALRASFDAAEEKSRAAEAALAAATADFAARESIWKSERESLEVERATLCRAQSTLQSEMTRSERSSTARNEQITRLEQELAEARAALAKRAAVVEPEIVTTGPGTPPPRVSTATASAASLADLERQAQAELARMGAAGRKSFFSKK